MTIIHLDTLRIIHDLQWIADIDNFQLHPPCPETVIDVSKMFLNIPILHPLVPRFPFFFIELLSITGAQIQEELCYDQF